MKRIDVKKKRLKRLKTFKSLQEAKAFLSIHIFDQIHHKENIAHMLLQQQMEMLDIVHHRQTAQLLRLVL
jgi:hypothetical protein